MIKPAEHDALVRSGQTYASLSASRNTITLRKNSAGSLSLITPEMIDQTPNVSTEAFLQCILLRFTGRALDDHSALLLAASLPCGDLLIELSELDALLDAPAGAHEDEDELAYVQERGEPGESVGEPRGGYKLKSRLPADEALLLASQLLSDFALRSDGFVSALPSPALFSDRDLEEFSRLFIESLPDEGGLIPHVVIVEWLTERHKLD